MTHIEAMKAMANYIDLLGGDSKKYRQAIAEESEKQSKLLEAMKWIGSHDLSGADDRSLALMSYGFVSKARFAVLDATGEKCEDLHKM